jgi:membrane fusion protein (multidrug efflux system)
VRAEVPNPDRLLRPGMLLSVRLYQAPRSTIVVPEIAVIQVGTEAFVYRVAADQTASRVKVGLGARRKGEVEIASGLAAGDTIVTEGAVKLRDGARVASAPPAAAGE